MYSIKELDIRVIELFNQIESGNQKFIKLFIKMQNLSVPPEVFPRFR